MAKWNFKFTSWTSDEDLIKKSEIWKILDQKPKSYDRMLVNIQSLVATGVISGRKETLMLLVKSKKN
jgi:hypothetical protein